MLTMHSSANSTWERCNGSSPGACVPVWHASNSRHIPLRKPKTSEPNNIFNNYRSDSVVRIATLVWDNDNKHNNNSATSHSWMLATQVRYTAFVGNFGNQQTWERRLTGAGQRWWSTIKVCQRVTRGWPSPYIDSGTSFHQLWGKTWH